MRLLFSATAGVGHVEPVLPLARAFVAAGDVVLFATAPSWRQRLVAEGFEFLPAGLEQDAAEARMAPHIRAVRQLPALERRPQAFTARFAIVEAPARLPDLREAVSRARPDLFVYESGDLVAPLVASERGLRSVHHGFGRPVSRACFELAAEVTEPLWRAAGLAPEPLGGLFRGVYVDLCPPSLADPGWPPPARRERLRPASVDTEAQAPAWLAALPERTTAYITLGTINNDLSHFRLALDALAGLDLNVVVTVGDRNNPADLAPLPVNAHVERYVPQAQILLTEFAAVLPDVQAFAGAITTVGVPPSGGRTLAQPTVGDLG